MKLKYYLRGIGIGIIVTTIILMIAFAVHRERPMTDDEIRERATELGMVMPENLPPSDKLSDKISNAGASDGKTKDDKPDVGISDEGKEEDKTQSEVVEQVEVTIVGGEYSDDVCKKLKKAGVIEDADDFNKYLAEGGYDNLIQPGNYVISLDADYDTIIKLITEKKR